MRLKGLKSKSEVWLIIPLFDKIILHYDYINNHMNSNSLSVDIFKL